MEINAIWSNPTKLLDGSKRNLIYFFALDKIPQESGCYIFYNKHGNSYSALYIGQADNLKKRLEQQQNNVKLMMGIKNSTSGHKHLVYCTIKPKQGQKLNKVLKLVEDNLIDIALSNGNELLNIQGTRNKYDYIIFSGNRHSEKMFGRKINIAK
jgi:GIY-YIG catalytic domain-containing protein